jgi:hypothetical protein
MWWDIIPFFAAPGDATRAELDEAALSVMEEILTLESLACRESAITSTTIADDTLIGNRRSDERCGTYPESRCSFELKKRMI